MAQSRTAAGAETGNGRRVGRWTLVLGVCLLAVPAALGLGYLVAAPPAHAEIAPPENGLWGPAGPLPAPTLAFAPAMAAGDYEIVSLFGNEAILAAGPTLVRAKVGSVVPGLGTIVSIDPAPDGGGSVGATEATLRTN